MEIKRMPKKEELEFTSPQQDPYILMKQQYEFLLHRLDSVEQRMDNLQVTWDRLLNVTQEPPLRQPYQQQQYQQPYSQQPYSQVGGQETTLPIKDTRPKWDIEKEKETEKPEKKRPSRATIMIFIAVVALLLVYMFLKSKGYGCAIPSI